MTKFPNWESCQDGFQSEHDIKFSIVIPFEVSFADKKE